MRLAPCLVALTFAGSCGPLPGDLRWETFPTGYVLGGTVEALTSAGLVLEETSAALSVDVAPAASTFEFAQRLPPRTAYAVRVATQPALEVCSVTGDTGLLEEADVRSVVVRCRPKPHLGGTVAGLDADGLALVERVSGATVAVAQGASTFRFGEGFSPGASYDVQVQTQPAGRTCTVASGAGTVTQQDVSSVQVSCRRTIAVVPLTGVVSGLTTAGLILEETTTSQTVDVAAGATAFEFPTGFAPGAPYVVRVRQHALSRLCTLANATGTVGTTAAIAVTCVPASTIELRLSGQRGDGLELTEQVSGQVARVAASATTARLPVPLLPGANFSVRVSQQPLFASCTVSPATGTASGALTTLDVSCALDTLVLHEVGRCQYTNTPCWIELHNPTPAALDAAQFELVASSLQAGAATVVLTEDAYRLPARSVPAGGYLVVAGRVADELPVDGTVAFVRTALGRVPYLGQGGVLRLRRVATQALTDSLTVPPLTTAAYARASALGTFAARDAATPGGPNDVTSATDADLDGIPDSAEVSGGRYAGLDLFALGARTGQRDLFVEVDFMPLAGSGGNDPGVQPVRGALDKIVQRFQGRGVVVHFDSGPLFDPASGVNPANYDLGGGNQLPFSCGLTLSGVAGVPSLYTVKWRNFDPRRAPLFHYVAFGHRIDVTSCTSSSEAAGKAELSGNDVIVGVGGQYTATDAATTQARLNDQAAVLMHELGHNLSLDHGGFESLNYKPNYFSIMNYLYREGLPALTAPGDRYAAAYGRASTSCGVPPTVSNGLTSPGMVIDFSDGTGGALNEAALRESEGVRRAGSGPIDFNLNGMTDAAAISVRLTGLNTAANFCPRSSSGTAMLRDSNDWGQLDLRVGLLGSEMLRSIAAPPSVRDPFDDFGRVVDETGFTPRGAR